jgi:hypothetical protein
LFYRFYRLKLISFFIPVRKDRKAWAFYNIYLRRHVKLNLRPSAFICGFGKLGQVILTETSARIASNYNLAQVMTRSISRFPGAFMSAVIESIVGMSSFKRMSPACIAIIGIGH